MEDRVMMRSAKLQPKLRHERERGSSIVEYALMVALISVFSLVALRNVGEKVTTTFQAVQDNMPGASRGNCNPGEPCDPGAGPGDL